MGENSKIEWTDHTFNPWVGCQKVSAGCANCYAEREMTRKPRWANAWGPPATSERLRTTEAYWRKPFIWQRKAEESGTTAKVFCGSLCDVFEDNRQVEHWRIELFEDVIPETPYLTWLILTKRPERAQEFFNDRPELLTGNIWLGVSAEDQQTANERIPILLQIPAFVRFVSAEPLLGGISLAPFLYHNQGLGFRRDEGDSIHWVIAGGESGPNARPMHPDQAWLIRDQCQDAKTPFFFKQWGEWLHESQVRDEHIERAWSSRRMEAGDGFQYIRVGKKAAGRLLDGREWNQFPQVIMKYGGIHDATEY